MRIESVLGSSINLATIVVALILIAITVTIVVKWYKDRKSGKSACIGNCSECVRSDNCNSKNSYKDIDW